MRHLPISCCGDLWFRIRSVDSATQARPGDVRSIRVVRSATFEPLAGVLWGSRQQMNPRSLSICGTNLAEMGTQAVVCGVNQVAVSDCYLRFFLRKCKPFTAVRAIFVTFPQQGCRKQV